MSRVSRYRDLWKLDESKCESVECKMGEFVGEIIKRSIFRTFQDVLYDDDSLFATGYLLI